jgi:hypothetical protein
MSKLGLEGIAFVVTFLVLSTSWYFYWVKPQDELRGRITQCMNETSDEFHHSQKQSYDSFKLYKFCHDKVEQ